MKKYRKRFVPDYESKYTYYDEEYYGVFIERDATQRKILSVKVDPKRMRKTGLIEQETYVQIQSINRNTPYFHPEKKYVEDYCYDTFLEQIYALKRLWNNEIKPAIGKLETPEEAGQKAFDGSISDGVLEYDECEMVRSMTSVQRSSEYEYAVRMFYAQFLLLLGSAIEAVLVEVITKKGYTGDKFNRESLKGFVSGRVANLDYTTFETHIYFDKLYSIWNLLKHNNKDVYQKVKERYPEVLINTQVEYKNGDLGFKYLKLNEKLILDLLEGLGRFFEEFCQKVFSEKTNYPEWNTEYYYAKLVDDKIEEVTNPLGLPWYL